MKVKALIVFAILVSLLSNASGQGISDIFDKNSPIVWLGLDFSQAKFIGDRERYGSSSDVKFLIKSWSDLIDKERKKYDPARATRKKTADYQLDVTRNHNEDLDVSEMLSGDKNDFLHLKEEDINAIVSSYEFKNLSGVGLMFIIESFSKLEEKASIWVTFINLNSKEIILTERMESRPSGASMRNYWGGSIANLIEIMEGKQMEVWKKKFSH